MESVFGECQWLSSSFCHVLSGRDSLTFQASVSLHPRLFFARFSTSVAIFTSFFRAIVCLKSVLCMCPMDYQWITRGGPGYRPIHRLPRIPVCASKSAIFSPYFEGFNENFVLFIGLESHCCRKCPLSSLSLVFLLICQENCSCLCLLPHFVPQMALPSKNYFFGALILISNS